MATMTRRFSVTLYLMRQSKIMRMKTTEQFAADLYDVNQSINVIGNYNGAREKILVECLVCGCRWAAIPNNLLRGKGCPRCAGNEKHTQESFLNTVNRVNPDVEVIGKYVSKKDKIEARCKSCGHIWAPIGDSLLAGHGCPKCKSRKLSADRMKNIVDFTAELSSKNRNIVIVSEYFGTHRNALFQCLTCGYQWNALPNNVLRGTGCPKCSASHGERIVSQILDRLNIDYRREYVFNDCRTKRVMPFDFYLPKYNACIEYDGIQHFEPVKYFGGVDGFRDRRKKDRDKNLYCLNNKIRLLRVPYYEDDIQDMISTFIRLCDEGVV